MEVHSLADHAPQTLSLQESNRQNIVAALDGCRQHIIRSLERHYGQVMPAEDLFQDATVKLLEEFKEGREVHFRAIPSWLGRTAHNAAIDLLRKKERHPEESLEAIFLRHHDSSAADLFKSPQSSPVQNMIGDEMRALIYAGIQRLPKIFSDVVQMCELEKKTKKEVALILGIPEGTVSSRLQKAHSLLRARLHAYDLGAVA